MSDDNRGSWFPGWEQPEGPNKHPLADLGRIPTIVMALFAGSAGSVGLVESLDLFGRKAQIERMAAVEDHILLLEESLDECTIKRDELGATLLELLRGP